MERGFLPQLRQALWKEHDTQANQYGKQVVQDNADVSDQTDIKSEEDRAEADDEEYGQNDDRSLCLRVNVSQLFWNPAVVAGLQDRLGNPREACVQSCSQRQQRAAEYEEQIQPSRQYNGRDNAQRLVDNVFQRRMPAATTPIKA